MIVVAQKANQLGNRLLVSSHVIALAAESGVQAFNVSIPEYAKYFAGPSQDWLCRYPPRRGMFTGDLPRRLAYLMIHFLARATWRLGVHGRMVRSINWRHRHSADDFDLAAPDFVEQVRTTRLLMLRGFRFRCYPLFHKHSDAIRAYFSPVPQIQARVADRIEALRRDCDTLVGIHIRRAPDMRTFKGGRWFYSMADYEQVMHSVRLLFNNRVRFLICTDAPDDLGEFPSLDVVPARCMFVDEMYLLAGCDYIVAPPSTFSRWAAFYGQVPLFVLDEPRPPRALADFSVPSA